MPKKLKQTCLWLFLLALVACGTTRQAAQPMWTTTVTSVTLADSLWTFSQTHPDGFTLNISTFGFSPYGCYAFLYNKCVI